MSFRLPACGGSEAKNLRHVVQPFQACPPHVMVGAADMPWAAKRIRGGPANTRRAGGCRRNRAPAVETMRFSGYGCNKCTKSRDHPASVSDIDLYKTIDFTTCWNYSCGVKKCKAFGLLPSKRKVSNFLLGLRLYK